MRLVLLFALVGCAHRDISPQLETQAVRAALRADLATTETVRPLDGPTYVTAAAAVAVPPPLLTTTPAPAPPATARPDDLTELLGSGLAPTGDVSLVLALDRLARALDETRWASMVSQAAPAPAPSGKTPSSGELARLTTAQESLAATQKKILEGLEGLDARFGTLGTELAAVAARVEVLEGEGGGAATLVSGQERISAELERLSAATDAQAERDREAAAADARRVESLVLTSHDELRRRLDALEKRVDRGYKGKSPKPAPTAVPPPPAPAPVAPAPPPPSPLAGLATSARGVGDAVRTARVDGDTLRVDLASDALFDGATATLTEDGTAVIAQLAEVVGGLTAPTLTVQAHTDGPPPEGGPFPTAQALTDARAAAVRDALVTAGLAPGSATAKGLGDAAPRRTDGTDEARAMDRRVELILVVPSSP